MSVLLTLLLLLPSAMAHVEMTWPAPLRSKFNPATPQSLIDYNMKSPLQASGSDFPCKGYQANTPQTAVTSYAAGSTYNVSFDGSATHGGGSCQLSLSYDNGKTFKVIKSMIGGCPLQPTYDFTIPTDAPSGQALFAWTWSNFMGNREFYMNCASVQVTGTSSKQARDTSSTFGDLPNIWVADLTSVNKCTTNGPNGSLNPVYPDPGSEVVYGAGMSSSSPPTAGSCEVPVAARQALVPSFTYSPDSSSTTQSVASTPTATASGFLTLTTITDFAPTTASPSIATTPASSASAATSNFFTLTTITDFASGASSSGATDVPQSSPSMASMSYGSLSSLATVTMTVDCPSTVTISLPPTVYPGTYTISAPSSACTATTANCPCKAGYSCMAIGTCTWACLAVPTTGITSFQTSVVAATTTPAAMSVATPATSVQTSAAVVPSQTPGQPDYVSPSNLQSYLPCVPGTFICTDPSTWYTCDQVVGGTWSYQYPRTVAAGMQCQPYLSPSGSVSQYGQQGNTPQGFYRDDQYVRATVYI